MRGSIGIVLTLLSCILAGCKLRSMGYAQDDEIDPALRADRRAAIQELQRVFSKGDPSELHALLAEGVRSKVPKDEAFTQSVALIQEAAALAWEPWHEIHVKASVPGMVPVQVKANPAFYFHADCPTGEQYVLLARIPRGGSGLLVSVQWARVEGAWQLFGCHSGAFTLRGKPAPSLYAEAKRLSEAGQPRAAYLRSLLAGRCLRPVSAFQYVDEDALVDVARDVATQAFAANELPADLPTPGGRVRLLSLEPIVTDKELMVVAGYATSLEVEPSQINRAAVEDQAARAAGALLERYPDLCEGADGLIMLAYHEPPVEPRKVYARYGTQLPCTRP